MRTLETSMHRWVSQWASALLCLLLQASSAQAQLPELPAQPAPPGDAELPRMPIHIDDLTFDAEIARDDPTRMRGLMFREALGDDQAMLFVFEQEQPLAFWMKNTHIPLDILYFDAAGTLVSLQRNVPPCRVARCPAYPSERAARFVVEVVAGTSTRLGIRKGAQLCWSHPTLDPPTRCERES